MSLRNRHPNKFHSYEGYDCKRSDFEHGLTLLANGNPDVDAIYELMTHFNANIIERPTRITRADVRGHRVNMGAVMSGSPLTMYRRVSVASHKAPVRIWVGTTSSIGISPADVTKRGAALAAFALALGKTRPVRITPYSAVAAWSGDGIGLVSCDLATRPLYVNELAAHMNVHLTRYVGMYAAHCISPHCAGAWPRGYEDVKPGGAMATMLNAKPDDIVLSGIHLHDPLLRDPIKWINEQIARFSEMP